MQTNKILLFKKVLTMTFGSTKVVVTYLAKIFLNLIPTLKLRVALHEKFVKYLKGIDAYFST